MLRVRDLKTAFLDVPSLDLTAGECVALMGASGAGKSLLLRAIADLDPNDGVISLDGKKRSEMPAFEWRARVALIPAESGWWADKVAAHFAPGSPDVSIIEDLGLPANALDWTVSRLSSGERHRLAIARALTLRPDVLLLDEPAASLDAASTKRLESTLRKEMVRGVAIILITHDLAQAERLAARTLVVDNGRISNRQEAAE